jgi:hypothetical protein
MKGMITAIAFEIFIGFLLKRSERGAPRYHTTLFAARLVFIGQILLSRACGSLERRWSGVAQHLR